MQGQGNLESSTAQAWTISKAYIQTAAAAGDVYDFSATPLPLLFSGSTGFAIASSTEIVSDPLVFSIPKDQNIVISYYTSGDATHDGIRGKVAVPNWVVYYKSGDDAATVDTSGYDLSSVHGYGIKKIEVLADSGFFCFYG